MIPARFDYDVAESVDHAIELLGAGGGDAKLLAGGHSLIPAMKLRISRPAKLVDIGRLSDLSYVKDGGTHVAIGATWLLSVYLKVRAYPNSPENVMDIELGGLYWHFVDLVWVAIFTLIYLLP